MLVELKDGETLNGHLVACDTWMNLTLKEVVQTSPVCLLSPIRLAVGCLLGNVLGANSGGLGRRQVCEITGSLRKRKQCMSHFGNS